MLDLKYYSYIFVLILVIYFVKEQFEHKQMNRLKFFAIPLFALYQFLSNIKIDDITDIVLVVSIFIVATVIGYLQTLSFEIDQQNIETHYFVVDSQRQEQQIMRRVYFVKGGLSYLIGWIAIFSVQIFVSLYFHEINFNEVEHEFMDELIKDIVVFLRFNDHKSWWIWELLAVSNFAYYKFLLINNGKFKEAIKHTKASTSI